MARQIFRLFEVNHDGDETFALPCQPFDTKDLALAEIPEWIDFWRQNGLPIHGENGCITGLEIVVRPSVVED